MLFNQIGVYNKCRSPVSFCLIDSIGNSELLFYEKDLVNGNFKPVYVVVLIKKGNEILLYNNIVPVDNVLLRDYHMAYHKNADEVCLEAAERTAYFAGARVKRNKTKLVGVSETDKVYYIYTAEFDGFVKGSIDFVSIENIVDNNLPDGIPSKKIRGL